MKIIPFMQRNQIIHAEDDMSVVTVLSASASELHADRRLYRHAPESAIVLGAEPGMSEFELFQFKTGIWKRTKVPVTPESTRHKAKALAAYIAETGKQVAPLILKRGRFIAAMDGISADHQLVVDIQFEDDDDNYDLTQKMQAGVVPEHHLIRLQHMMAVADAAEADVWLYSEKYRSGRRVTVRRHVGYFARIFTAWQIFQERMDGGGWFVG